FDAGLRPGGGWRGVGGSLRAGVSRWGTFEGGRIAGADIFARRGALRVDGVAQEVSVANGREAANGDFREGRIGEIGGAVGECSTHGFDDPVDGLGVVPGFQFNGCEDVERFDGRNTAGAGRRAGDDLPLVAPDFVGSGEYFADFNFVVRE